MEDDDFLSPLLFVNSIDSLILLNFYFFLVVALWDTGMKAGLVENWIQIFHKKKIKKWYFIA